MLYHALPIAFWLLAVAGSALAWFLLPSLEGKDAVRYVLPPLIVLVIMFFLSRIERHTSSVEESFGASVLLGVVSYWMPTVVFLLLPMWIYLLYRNVFSFRSLLATLLGSALVSVWASVLVYMGWIDCPWTDFFATKNLWAWIPTGATIIAFLASTISRRILRVR